MADRPQRPRSRKASPRAKKLAESPHPVRPMHLLPSLAESQSTDAPTPTVHKTRSFRRGKGLPSPNPAGRGQDKRELGRENILHALRLGATMRLAAEAGGYSYEGLLRWRKEDPDMEQAVREAQASFVTTALSRIQAASLETWQAAAWLLERRLPEEYGRSIVRQEQSGEVTHRLVIQYVDDWRGKAQAQALLPDPDVIDGEVVSHGDENTEH